MTQDYRKLAEYLYSLIHSRITLINDLAVIAHPAECKIDIETALFQVAQEARREENEACAKAVEKADCDPKCIPFGDHISSCQWSMLPEKIIRSRMEEK